METRQVMVWSTIGALASLAIVSLTCAYMGTQDESLASLSSKAERVIVATIEADQRVSSGESFVGTVRKVLRGPGKPKDPVRITIPSQPELSFRLKKETDYVFLLEHGPRGKGWQLLGDILVEQVGDKIRVEKDGKLQEELALVALDDLLDANPLKAQQAPAAVERNSLAGKWLIRLSEGGSDFVMGLIQITPKGDGWSGKLLAGGKVLQSFAVDDVSGKGNSVELRLKVNGLPFVYRGTLDKSYVRGEMWANDSYIIPTMLEPTDLNDIDDFKEGVPTDGKDEYIDVADKSSELDEDRADNPSKAAEIIQKQAALWTEFIDKFSGSPMAIMASSQRTHVLAAGKDNDAALRKSIDDHIALSSKWGPGLALEAHMAAGIYLQAENRLPELAMSLLSKVEAGEFPAPMKNIVIRTKAKLLLSTGKGEEGLKIVRDLLKKSKFDAELTFLYARESEVAGNIDDALSAYAELSALPMMERALYQSLGREGLRTLKDEQKPAIAVERLWLAKHDGKREGLDEYLTEVYEKGVRVSNDKPVPPRKAGEGNRTVLMELFTGATCPPCVGPDVATGTLEHVYSPTELIVLRYHLHIPGPDPLTSPDSETRFTYYEGEGTPTLMINGRSGATPGFLAEAIAGYADLKPKVDEILKEKVAYKIDLSAKTTGDVLKITANATGAGPLGPKMVLRVCVAEDRIVYPAANGIRVHEMVVRALVGGHEGVAPSQGKLTFSQPINLRNLQTGLARYLKSFETENELTFDAKPLDLSKLHVVAWIQNDSTREVVQAVAVPVDGLAPAAGAK